MKLKFETAEEMREKILQNVVFRAYCTTLRVWSSEQHVYVHMEDKHPRRAVLENDREVFIYNHKSSRYGQRLPIEYFISQYMIDYVEPVDPAIAWERRVRNVIKKLEASGLWPNIKKTFEELLAMGYERRRKLRDLFWNDSWEKWDLLSAAYKDPDGVDAFNSAFENHYGELMNEIPFAFHKDRENRGKWGVKTDLIFEMSDAKTKSMYFGRGKNARIKSEIQEAMDSKYRYVVDTRTSYDVRFEYDPEENKAWYSEEYKDCGNGHYYLAIDANTALFYEND